MTIQMTIRQAAAQARKYPHGCKFHCDATQVLYKGFYRALGRSASGLDELWDWVNGYLQMEKASYGPTPLG